MLEWCGRDCCRKQAGGPDQAPALSPGSTVAMMGQHIPVLLPASAPVILLYMLGTTGGLVSATGSSVGAQRIPTWSVLGGLLPGPWPLGAGPHTPCALIQQLTLTQVRREQKG